MAGVLGVLPRQVAFNAGVVVPGAQLFVYEDATTTKRNIYTTSALAAQLSNPLVADANGRFAAFYVNPNSGAYKLVLASASDTDPPASPFWTEDVLPVPGASIIEGSFTATITGCGTDPTGTVNYIIVADAAGTGKKCRLYTLAAISAESDANSMTLTGIPAACVPTINANVSCNVLDNGGGVQAGMTISPAGTTATFFCDTPLSSAGFTTSGVKGLPAGWQAEYVL